MAGTETLTGKTLTGNIAVTLVSGAATITLPTTTSTLATLALTETLTNKTLSGNTAVTLVSGAATVTLPTTTGTLATLGNAETFTGVKTFGGAGAVGKLKVAGTTSGSTIIDATAVAGSGTVTLPTTGTLATTTGAGATKETFAFACSDETTLLTTGLGKVEFQMPYAFTVTEVFATVTTVATGATLLTIDINEAGTSIISTKITLDASEKTSRTAATPPVISDSSLANSAVMTIDIDAVGNTTAGKGLKVYIVGYQT